MTIKGHFYVPIYDCEVVITISDQIKHSLNYYCNKFDTDKVDYNFSALTWRPQEHVHTYYLFFDKEDLDSNLFNHEKSHLVEWILKDRSISAQNEVRSYLDGFISKKMTEFFQKRKIKLK